MKVLLFFPLLPFCRACHHSLSFYKLKLIIYVMPVYYVVLPLLASPMINECPISCWHCFHNSHLQVILQLKCVQSPLYQLRPLYQNDPVPLWFFTDTPSSFQLGWLLAMSAADISSDFLLIFP